MGVMKAARTHALFAAAALAFVGCSDNGVAPIQHTPDDADFEVRSVPLDLGMRWTYSLDFTNEWFSDAPITLPPPIHLTATGTRTIERVETLDGRDYVVEHQVVDGGGTLAERWTRYRQDDGALYRADVSLNAPTGSLDPGDTVDDLTRLVYPLEVGATWTQQPHRSVVTYFVESLDTLSLSVGDVPAYRIRVDVAADGDNDLRLVWYGAYGLIRRYEHREIVAVDAETLETARIVSEEVEELTEVQVPIAARAAQ
jgi:hypothetical protein